MPINRRLEQGFPLARIISCSTAVLVVACVITTHSLAHQDGRPAVAPASLQLVDDLVVGNRILANEGVLDGLGHISVRHRRPITPAVGRSGSNGRWEGDITER